MNDLATIEHVLSVDEEVATVILGLCDWVDHELAIERFGYPKDNVIAAPMSERLADRSYLERLIAVAKSDDEVSDEILALLVAHRDRAG